MNFPVFEVPTHTSQEVYMKYPEQHPADDANHKRLLPGTDTEHEQPSLEDLYSSGDWVFDASLRYAYGRVIAVRNSDLDVDFGRYTSTMRVYFGAGTAVGRWGNDRRYMRVDDLEKVAGPESETPGESSTVHPESDSDADVYVSLDERHGIYSGKRGRLTRRIAEVGESPEPGSGTYFEVEFPDDPAPVLIADHCVYGMCRKFSPHPDFWCYKH